MKTNKIWIVILAFALSLVGSASADLVAHYQFEGDATDSSGTYDGTLFGDPAYEPGVFGRAINLDGVGDYVNCPGSSVLNMTNRITVAAWVNINAVDKAWQAIVTKGDSAWRLSTSGMQNKFQFGVTGPPDWHVVDGLIEIPAGEWHHVCGTFDGFDIRLYLDGELDNIAAYEGSISANTYEVCIGENNQVPGRCWNGLIDDVRIYDSELGPTEVQALVDVPLGSGEAFTYEGRLLDEGNPADGSHDFQFKLFDAPVLGAQLGDTIDINDLDVIDGYFTVELDFDSELFDGNQRWLQVSVRSGASTGSYTILNPRIAITPTPYALHAFSCAGGSGGDGHSLDAADGSPEDVVYVDSVGNVGIDTTSPLAKLHIEELSSADPLRVRVSGSTKLIVKNNGNVGIGLLPGVDPVEKLDIGGSVKASQFMTFDPDYYLNPASFDISATFAGSVGIGTTNPETNLHVYKGTGGGSDPISLVDPLVVESDNNAYINVITPNDKWGGILFSDEGRDRGGIRYDHSYDVMDFRTANTTRVAINSQGNVGIGTTTPQRILHIRSSSPEVLLEETDPEQKKWHIAVVNSGLTIAETGVGDWLYVKPGGNVGIGAANPTRRLTVRGNILIQRDSDGSTVMELGEGLDFAEGFDVSDQHKIEAGSVLIIDAENPGKLVLSNKSYDTKVAGIVAGANGMGSGVRLGAGEFDYDVALAGRVYCKVDATEQAVEPGDLLTTSPVPGHAMKAMDYTRAQGAILGKAMESLEKGQKGQILVLVTLQ